jgi:hypothetical protein
MSDIGFSPKQRRVLTWWLPGSRDAAAGLNFQGSGCIGTPLGAQVFRTSQLGDGILVGLDNRYTLEQICCGEVLVEYDKLIDRQLERAAITSISGFSKICADAAAMLCV